MARMVAICVLFGATAGAGYEAKRRVLPQGDEVARGVVFNGEVVEAGTSAESLVARHADRLLARRVVIRHGAEVLLDQSLSEIGAAVDREAAVAHLNAIARTGEIPEQWDEAVAAQHGKIAVALPVTVPAEAVLTALADHKVAFDHKAVPARWDYTADKVVPHADAEMMDLYGAASAVAKAVTADPLSDATIDVAVPILRASPAATTEAVEALDRTHVVSSFETRFGFVGNQTGRAQNVTRAAQGIDGLVMMPGEVVSFNDLVGPRSIENGFAHAGEIYKGEMRRGVGGGTCQVASTFHAAAYLGGLEVVQRSPHSRPSGYIRIGLDATVAFPHVDLKMKNPFPFAVLVHAFIRDRGTLVVELMGRERPVTVAFDAATVGVKNYKRKVRVSHWLEEGRIIRKQAGRKGVTIKKLRKLVYTDGTEKVEETHDHYPPTMEIYYVPPGTDVESELPPLPQDS